MFISIDKATAARAALVDIGAHINLDDYHLKVAFSEHLKSSPFYFKGPLLALVNHLINIANRALTQEKKDIAIRAVISCLEEYNAGVHPDHIRSPAVMESAGAYVKEALGYTGSIWEGMIGDIAVLNSDGTFRRGGTQVNEAHFSAIRETVANGLYQHHLAVEIAERYAGVNGQGTAPSTESYWETMNNHVQTRERQSRIPVERAKREAKGAWLVCLQNRYQLPFLRDAPTQVQLHDLYVFKARPDELNDPFFFVRKEVPSIFGSNVNEGKKVAANRANLREMQQSIPFTKERIELLKREVIVPPDVPVHPSGLFHVVNIITGECFLCEDFVDRGCKNMWCKHANAGRLESKGMHIIKATVLKMFEYVRNREHLMPEQLKNSAIWDGDIPAMFLFFVGGGKSNSSAVPAENFVDGTQDSDFFFLEISSLDALHQSCTLVPLESGSCAHRVIEIKGRSGITFFANSRSVDQYGAPFKHGNGLKMHDVVFLPLDRGSDQPFIMKVQPVTIRHALSTVSSTKLGKIASELDSTMVIRAHKRKTDQGAKDAMDLAAPADRQKPRKKGYAAAAKHPQQKPQRTPAFTREDVNDFRSIIEGCTEETLQIPTHRALTPHPTPHSPLPHFEEHASYREVTPFEETLDAETPDRDGCVIS